MRRENQLPFLAEYVRYAVSWRRRRLSLDLPPRSIAIGAASSLGIIIAITCLSHGLQGLASALAVGVSAFALYMFFAFRASLKFRSGNGEPERETRQSAFISAERLECLLDAKRLKRDLSPDVFTLLEDAAQNWKRARSILFSTHWQTQSLRPSLSAVREQSILAIDQGMQEMLALLATSIPERARRWTITELIDEITGRERKSVSLPVPIFLEEATFVSQKLSELAIELEQASKSMSTEALLDSPQPGARLEATLLKMKEIRKAEDELNRNYLNSRGNE
jgi:hypothetical protein